jgi:hypothetical protein
MHTSHLEISRFLPDSKKGAHLSLQGLVTELKDETGIPGENLVLKIPNSKQFSAQLPSPLYHDLQF